jgi:large subunit ribosomal protein L24
VLSFEARAPRFEGAVILAAPPAARLRSASGDASQAPWRISARIKADPAAARLEQLEASYGAEESALKFSGIADIRFEDRRCSCRALRAAARCRQACRQGQ